MVETVTLSVTDPDNGEVASITIGAYNCGSVVLAQRVTEALGEYVRHSDETGELLSLSDFCLHLLGEAAIEHALEGR